MNAHFRRDYLYLMTITALGREQKIPVRYLKFDRTRKEYIFVEGAKRSSTEVQFRFKLSQAVTAIERCTKQQHIGYEDTNYYIGYDCQYKLPLHKRIDRLGKALEQWDKETNKEIKFEQLEIGKKYKFKTGTSRLAFLTTEKVLECTQISTENGYTKAEFIVIPEGEFDIPYGQTCAKSWLDSGEMIAELVA